LGGGGEVQSKGTEGGRRLSSSLSSRARCMTAELDAGDEATDGVHGGRRTDGWRPIDISGAGDAEMEDGVAGQLNGGARRSGRATSHPWPVARA
jgi:hypothetical protein